MSKLADLTGARYGRLVVESRAVNDANGKTRWVCKCDCGAKTVVFGTNIRRGLTTSCGCFHKEVASKTRLIKIDRRKKFGKLKVVGDPVKKRSKTFYPCKCSCGCVVEAESYALRHGLKKSCGCLHGEVVTTHGRSHSKEYKIAKAAERRATVYALGSNWSVEEVECKFDLQKHLCYYCGVDLQVSGFHVEHMVPLSRGGSNDVDNICLSCPKCNLRKGTKTADEFLLIKE